MRLTAIKLAGFKSFVDPTTFRAPTNLTGIVGPNGCGKSNIIDAVRWVMGEGSAKVLRGENMADVIFSGSSARKPVGTATVELLFDNSEGRVAGEYAGFNEISVKRQVSRDGISQYFLNGARCRRKDITDLFLGTGLGSRSYSIIEQGTISQIVDARPEEIRSHLEEAAGISKYKERRRETERRIQHTRDNLDRLTDLREEVGKHLARLQRQANAAERYTALKQERRDKESLLLALQWRTLHEQAEQGRAALSGREAKLAEKVADQRKAESEMEALHEAQNEAGEAVNSVQAEVFEAGSAIARLEQQVQHARELHQRREQERDEIRESLQDLEQHMVLDRAQLEELATGLADIEPKLETATADERGAAESASGVEAEVQAWQEQLEQHHARSSKEHRVADGLRSRIELLEKRMADGQERLDALDTESGELEAQGVPDDLAKLEQSAREAATADQSAEATVAERRQARDEARQAVRETVASQYEVERALHAAEGRLDSLRAMQAAGAGSEEAADWLGHHGLDDAPRAASRLDVDEPWLPAVETVLGHWLDAVVVDDPARLAPELASLEKAAMAVVGDQRTDAGDKNTLAARVRGPEALVRMLSRVRLADDDSAARAAVSKLGPDESVISPSGLWLGLGWARVARGGGVLVRERDIRDLDRDVQRLTAELEAANQARTTVEEALEAAEAALQEANDASIRAHRERTDVDARLAGHRRRAGDLEQRQARIADERERLQQRFADDRDALKAARAELEDVLKTMASLESDRSELDAQRKALLTRRDEARESLKVARERRHELALQAESRRASRASLDASLARMDSQLSQLQKRLVTLTEQLAQEEDPVAARQDEMDTLLEKRTEAERRLAEARTELQSLESKWREHDQVRQQAVRAGEELRSELERARLGQQEIELHARNLERQVEALELELSDVVASLPDDADPEAWASELEKLGERITRMEPVNLAAIQEYEEEQKRKEYLDSQNEDLCEALSTLESAIARIDRQTRTRFKDTFERVNKGVQELFPRLFGGGHAYLEMTGDDLLTTGVAIMARPPGKRVSSIHLLSGGEKALTAAAFVFAIFQLNPAPFCMLDEVDAPLDDANVGRFSNMVLEMSDNVQFIVVTHNKITMENMHQLSGVTMREPGVSRLVQVDVEQAVQYAEA